MLVSKKRNSRGRLLGWCMAAAILCVQASTFFACSFSSGGDFLLPGPQPPTPSVSISVSPTSIVLGQSAVLSWSSSGVTACTASGAWSGAQDPKGSTTVKPSTSGTFSYVLNCSTSASGSIAQAATLTVIPVGTGGSARRAVDTRLMLRARRTDLGSTAPSHGANAVAEAAPAYTALAIASSSTPGAKRLYAADFRNGRVDVFDASFSKQIPTATRFAFTDPALPAGYAPFGIAVIDELLYVAYALQSVAGTLDAVAGRGQGLIDVFTLDGDFITRLVMPGSALNVPWAMAAAPRAGALRYAHALLVANTGDGTISAFDAESGVLLGVIRDERGEVLVIPRLHALDSGEDRSGRATLFFSAEGEGAGPGLYGRLDLLDSADGAQ